MTDELRRVFAGMAKRPNFFPVLGRGKFADGCQSEEPDDPAHPFGRMVHRWIAEGHTWEVWECGDDQCGAYFVRRHRRA